MSIRALLDRGHPRAPDLDRVGTWRGTDRPLLLRGALTGRVLLLEFWTSGCVNCLHGGRKADGAIHPAADARTTALRSPWDVAFLGDTLWIAMAGAHQLWQLDPRTGALAAGAGSGHEGLEDGTLADATFAQPGGLTVRGARLVVADTDHHRLVAVDAATGAVSSLVPSGVTPPSVRGMVERPVLATRALPVQHLEDAPVASNGAALVLEVRLPEGHTFTAGAPQRIELSVAGRSAPVQLEASAPVLRATTSIPPLETPTDAAFSVALFYCRDGHGSVCLVDRRRLVTRLVPAGGGPAAAIVHYRPTPPGPRS